MAEAAGAVMAAAGDAAEAMAPLLHGLPDEIVVWEILVRLPPKPVLRCRAVSAAWRRATSARDFLLAHHARQPSLALLPRYVVSADGGVSLRVVNFDHRAAVDKLQVVARLGRSFLFLEASCDGLLVLAGRYRKGYSICNPETRQHARLPQLDGFTLLGMYPHGPTGEYRMLLRKTKMCATLAPVDFYVLTLGTGHPARRISCLDEHKDMMVDECSFVLCHGSLHWHLEKLEGPSNMIKVFDTTTESSRQIRAPAAPGKANLFEIDGMLGLSSVNDAAATIDIWMMKDYEREAWAFKCRVELPVSELTRAVWKVSES